MFPARSAHTSAGGAVKRRRPATSTRRGSGFCGRTASSCGATGRSGYGVRRDWIPWAMRRQSPRADGYRASLRSVGLRMVRLESRVHWFFAVGYVLAYVAAFWLLGWWTALLLLAADSLECPTRR